MDAPLDPQAFGQVLTRIWQLMRPNLKLFVAIGAVPAGAALVLYGVAGGLVFTTVQYVHRPLNTLSITLIAGDCVVAIFALAAAMLVMSLYEPAASYTGLQLDAGRAVTFTEAYSAAWNKAGRYFWLLLLRQIILGAPMLAAVAIFGAGQLGLVFASKGNGVAMLAFASIFLAVVLYLAAMVWAILALIRLVLAFPACIAEDLTAWEAIRRSNRLSQGGRLRIFLVALVLYAINNGVVLASELAFGIVAGLGAIPILVLHLGPVWSITGLVLLGICFVCVLLLLAMCVSSSYSVAFAILYREQIRLQAGAALPATPGAIG